VIAALAHLSHLTRAGYVFAREGVLGLIDPRPLPWPARAGLKVARLIERPSNKEAAGRLATALTKLGPT
jgi:ubiquinone biosynthesis protein